MNDLTDDQPLTAGGEVTFELTAGFNGGLS